MYKTIVTAITLLTACHSVLAADKTIKSEWKGEAEAGYVSTSGNTKTKTSNIKAKIVNQREKWRHSGGATALSATDRDRTTAEKYTANVKTEYTFSDKNYIYGLIDYDNDRFSGYQYRLSESIGYGRRVIDKTSLKLDLEVGPGARQSKLDNGSNEDEFTGRGGLALLWTISETSKFTEDLSVDVGENSTITRSVSALTASIAGNFAMKLSYTVKHTSDPLPGIEDLDTETAVTLVYTY